jgi:hypothetical protein
MAIGAGTSDWIYALTLTAYQKAVGLDPKNYERNASEFLVRQATLGHTVNLEMRDYAGGQTVIANTPDGQFWFLPDADDKELTVMQVL